MQMQTQNKKVKGVKVPALRFPEFSGEWGERRLGETADLKNGYAFKSVGYEGGGEYRVITIGNVKNGKLDIEKTNAISKIPEDLQDHQKLSISDILVSMTGNVGRVCVVDKENCLLNQRVGKIIPTNERIDRSFVYQCLNGLKFEFRMRSMAQGGAQDNISKSDILSFRFFLPPLPEQQKIAEFLGAVDEKIERLSRKKGFFERYKKGVMQKIFSQELRFKDENGDSYPNWEEKKLREVFEITAGKSKSIHIALTGEYIIVDMGGISSDGRLIAKKYTDYAEDFLTTNDLVMPKDDIGGGFIIGRVARIPEDRKYIYGDHIFKLTKKHGDIGYLFYMINSFSISRSFRKKANGTAQLGLGKCEVENQKISFPFLSEQKKIADFLTSLDEKISAISSEIVHTKDFKKGLLQQMFV